MAMNSKKRKFLATSLTATMVAAAVAPTAGFAAEAKGAFPDVPADHWAADAINYLVAKGAINGLPDGNYGPSQSISRAAMAKILAESSENIKVVEGATPSFSDVSADHYAAKYIAALEKAGIVNGNDKGLFDPSGTLTREAAAKMIVETYGLKLNEDADISFPDNKGWGKDYINIVASLGILEGTDKNLANPTGDLSRAALAQLVYRAEVEDARVEVPKKEAEAPAVESVSAINAKTIEVKFDKAVDTDKANIELLRDTFKQNITVKWADDHKSVQLVGAGNFQAGNYTVNITGLSEKVLTGSVKIEDQKVSSIEILSDVAVLSSNPNGVIDKETATVGYVVKDQYGTDITKTTTLTTNNNNDVIANKGKITLSNLKGQKVGDVVPVVLVHAESGTTTTKTVKLSAASAVADITVDGIYNAKGQKVELTDATKAADVFLVVNLKDQYGNVIEPKTGQEVNGVIVTNTNPLVTKVDNKVTTQQIGDKTKFVVKFEKLDANNEFKGGAAELLFISTMDGKTFNHTINVAETKTTDAVSISQPEFAISGEDVKLPITVTDKEGNVITDTKLLAHATKGIKVDGKPVNEKQFEVKDGQAFYNLGPAGAAGTYKTVVVQTSTNKVATTTFKINEEAKPVAVRGLKEKLVLTADDKKEIKFEDVNVEDQYGRTMEKLPEGYSVKVKNTAQEEKIVTVTDEKTVVAGDKNGTATITIYLADAKGEVKNSAVEQKVQVTDGKEYKSYEIKEIGLVDATTGKDFVVQGVLDNGGKVKLDPVKEYTAVTNVKGVTIENGKIVVDDSAEGFWKVDGKDVTEREVKATVTINADGSKVEQTFKISNAASKVQDFFFTTAIVDSKFEDAKAINEAVMKSNTFTIADAKAEGTSINVATTDQYDNKKVVEIAADTVTIVPEKAADVNITGNGTAGATATLAKDVEKAKLTVKVTIGGSTQDLKVTLEAPDTATADAADVATVKSSVLGATYAEEAQKTVEDKGDLDAQKAFLNENVKAVINALDLKDVSYEIVDVSYDPAVAGTDGDAATKAGTAGSYKFKVKLTKGASTDTTNEITLTINATPFE